MNTVATARHRVLLQAKYFRSFIFIMTTSDWIGAVGVVLTLIAYFCSTFNVIQPNGRLFFLLNAVGAMLTCLGSYLISYWPFFVLEATWAVVSLIGFVKAKP